MILEIGRIIANRYEIAELIGAGGMSHVYRAIDKKLHRSVTVKVLREEYITDSNFVDRFDREARAIASLNHANIVNVYDVGNEGDVHYIVMEYIAGKTLKELITSKAPFSNETMLGVASQIAAALIHAHENGIIHRDIKPQNVLCMPNGVVKVADFGIAKSRSSKDLKDDDFSTMGSVHYVSPEVACSDPIDPRSDLYSLGIVMYEMMTGELPFDSDNADDIAMLHVEAPLPNIRKKNPKVLPVVREIIVRLTNKQPFRRYQSASSLYGDIQRAVMESAEEDYRSQPRAEERPSPFDKKPRPHEIPQSHPRPRPPRPERDVNFSNSPTVASNNKNKERLIIIGGVATATVLIAALVFVVFWFMGGGSNNELVRVPDIIDMELETAREELEAIGLYLEIYGEEPHEYIEEGHITQADFREGDTIQPGTTVNVVVSLGLIGDVGAEQVLVPNIVGMHLDAAVVSLDGALRVYDADYRFDSVFAHNYILEQHPPAGEYLMRGEQIRIVLSLGEEPETIEVPDIVGILDSAARSALVQSGLRVGREIPTESPTHSVGIVTWQSVSAGTEVPVGSYIDFMVSSGIIQEPEDEEDEPDDNDTTDDDNQNDNQNIDTNDDTDDDNVDTNGENNGTEDNDDPSDGQNQEQNQGQNQLPTLTSRTVTINPVVPADVTVEISLVRRMPDGSLGGTEFMGSFTGLELPQFVTVQGTGIVEFRLLVNGVDVGGETVNFND